MTEHGTHRRSHGFTLIEMMIVVILLGVIASVASSAWSQSADYRLNLVQIEISDAVSFAKAHALSTREAHGVVFDPTTERLAVVDASGTLAEDTLTKGDYVVDFQSPQHVQGIDITSADFGDAGVALVVRPDGTALSGGTVVIILDGVSRVLTVDPATATLSSS